MTKTCDGIGRWELWEVTKSEANMEEQSPFLPAPPNRLWVLSPSGGWWLGMLAWVEGEMCPCVTLGSAVISFGREKRESGPSPGWLVCDLGWSIQEDLEPKSKYASWRPVGWRLLLNLLFFKTNSD